MLEKEARKLKEFLVRTYFRESVVFKFSRIRFRENGKNSQKLILAKINPLKVNVTTLFKATSTILSPTPVS